MRTVPLQSLFRTAGVMLFACCALAVVASGARAENLDEGKSGPKLFAEGCAACHHSARGLAKGRFRVTLYFFLQEHYASNASAAWALTSYLESVDQAPRGKAQHAAASKPRTSRASGFSRPPMPIPQH